MLSGRPSPSPLFRRALHALGWGLFVTLALVELSDPVGDDRAGPPPAREARPSAGKAVAVREAPVAHDASARRLNPSAPETAPVDASPTVPGIDIAPAVVADSMAGAAADSALDGSWVPGPAADDAVDSPDVQEGIFELVVDGLDERILVLVVVDERGNVLIPVREVLERVEIPVATTEDGLRLEWPRDVWRTEIDFDAGTVRVGDREPRSLDPERYLIWNGALHVTAPAMEALIDASVQVVWSDLVIHVAGEQLPVTVRRRRELSRRLFGGGRSPFGPDPLEAVPFEPRTGGLAATWGVNAFTGDGVATHGSARVSVGGSLWGGATDVTATTSFTRTGGAELDDLAGTFSRPVFGSEWLSRVELGAVPTGGVLPRRVLGGALSNEPYLQPRHFGETAVVPVVPSGWDYEVYQGNHLVGASDGVGPADIRADVNYGHTPVRVRLLGPAGQEIVEEMLFVVSPRQVPAGKLRYDVAAGVCRDTDCANHAAAEVRYGLDERLTLGGGAERLDPGSATAPELGYHVSATARPLPNLSADLRLTPGSFVQAGAQFMPSRGTSATASYLWQGEDGLSGGFGGWQGRMALSTSLPILGSRRPLSANVFLRGTDAGQVDAWRAGLSSTIGRSFVSADVEAGLQASSLLTLAAYTPMGDASSLLRDLAVNAAFAVSARRTESLEAGLSFRPTGSSTLQAGVRLRQGQWPRFTVSFTTRALKAFAQARATASDGYSTASVSLDGGAALGGSGGTSFFPLPGTGHAGVSGRVFIDANANGVRDPDEVPVTDVPVSIGGHRVPTDEDGRFRSWGLRAYEAIAVHVDSLSIDFDLKPAQPEVVVRPSPNRFHTVDLPLVRTKEVTGRVVGSADRPLGGVRVEVVGGDGTVVASGRTFSDGELYIQRVPVGTYTLRVADSSLQAMGAVAHEVSVVVPSDGDSVVEAPALELRRDR